ncbi:MtrB/PioB family decaheme-associated outer membrane protein [Zoogloea sp. LCSB751]|uniref:MtrB/PioB family decaheme-associated outer membrane protein n=1 Tax=Zoogloea sp. LCSB751 TaxID=1965277 RepID=UPI0013747729|nr:MtrB/PioB family decaheme-associated outer membrane protein [Zoogloea sp. LCSB751]
MSKHLNFRQTAIVMALSAVFPVASVWADEVEELTSPNKTEAALNLPYYSAVNPLYRQYSGVNNEGFNGNVDIDVVRRDEEAKWFKLNARNLGLRTQELDIRYEKQGDWSLGLSYDQIPRYAPYDVTTAVQGVGRNTIVQPNIASTAVSGNNPNAYDVTLKTERAITTLTASKFVAEGLKLGFSFKNEDKTGTRMDGVRGVAGTGTPNLYSGFLFSPEPIDQNHKQFEATVDYVSSKFQLTGGYYGSFLSTKYSSLTVTPGSNTALVVPGLSPIALAPDNSVQQFYVNGAYNFTKDTRASLKVSYSEGRQDDNFLAGQATLPGIGENLMGVVRTTEVFSSITSRINKDLKLLASWRYEDRQDKTPIRLFATSTSAGVTTNYYNNPESHVANWGKLEADYRIGGGYSVTAGFDYYDKSSLEWERHRVSETTSRLALRKTMSETVNGTLSLAHSERTGSDWFGATALPIYPVYLADRNRDKVRGMLDWSATESLNLQVAYEAYFDDYRKSTYGLDKGKGQVLSLDGSYTLSDIWKLNAWYSKQTGESSQNMQGAACTTGNNSNCTVNTFRTGTLIQWDATLKQNSDQFGVGVNGKVKMVDVGAQFLYSQDTNKQLIGDLPATTCTNATCTTTGALASGMGVLPDTKYTQNTLKLNATYPVSKQTRVRLDYIYDLRKMDDYTWSQWVYADGTKVFVKPDQVTQIIGLSLLHAF